MRHAAFILLSVAWLGGCVATNPADEQSPYYVLPAGSTVTLHQELAYPPEEVGVYFQGGRIVHKSQIDLYRPHCRLEVNDRLPVAQSVKPDTFRVVRATQEILHSVQAPVLLAANGVSPLAYRGQRASDSPSPELYATRMTLRSERQPNVIRLTCGHLESPPAFARHLTLQQIRQTLGNLITLQSRASS